MKDNDQIHLTIGPIQAHISFLGGQSLSWMLMPKRCVKTVCEYEQSDQMAWEPINI